MKASLVALVTLSAQLAAAHYTLPDLIANSTTFADWLYVRETANHYSNGPVTDVTSEAIRCYELDYTATAPATSIATVQAGSTVGFKGNDDFYHPGYFSAYMSPAAPAANSASAAESSTWFKIWEDPPVFENGALVFPSQTIDEITFTIPKNLPSGQYLLRGEQIALHVAESYGGAQFYIGCAQLNVVDGGDGTPGPTVAFPGAYTGYEPGILINIYDLPAGYTGYQSPGPAVWSG
ncbi:glycoside hydrolase family 61 protein [Gelatoporia subvermispora B]|uniref:lytic cellulose monooxygenase (C4-dehydrogenating) n=1 Tax=Ceriporiopsis subvermispora (strain B) TaxID=914234 RepID=M2R9L3_CERS8|nr:glycoside hydrolase family 61 protein [Gelatoporia subvermispora B]